MNFRNTLKRLLYSYIMCSICYSLLIIFSYKLEYVLIRYFRQNSSYRSQYCKNGTTPGEKTALLKSNISEDEDDQVRQHPSLHKCCLQLYGLAWFRGACLKLCCDISTLLQPLILK